MKKYGLNKSKISTCKFCHGKGFMWQNNSWYDYFEGKEVHSHMKLRCGKCFGKGMK